MTIQRLVTFAHVTRVIEHTKTIRGRRDPVSGASVTESINLGWFIHLDFDDDSLAEISLGVGSDHPGFAAGDRLRVTLEREANDDAH